MPGEGALDGIGKDVAGVNPAKNRAIQASANWQGTFGLGFRIGALSTLTLGIYRFWGKTRLRRYFWSKIEVLGDPLEYIGRPRELFLGFLLAMVFLGPLFIAYSMAQALMPPLQAALFNAVLAVVVVFLSGVATFSAYRYLMTRTLWRGIRGGVEGSAWRYGLYSFGWTLLSLLTLFAIHPIAHRATRRRLAGSCRIGTQHFALNPPLMPLMRVWLMAWTPLVLGLVILASLYGGALLSAMRYIVQDINPEQMSVETRDVLTMLPAFYMLMIVAFVLFSAFYGFLRFKVYANAFTLGQVRMTCDLGVARTALSQLGRVFLTLLVAGIPLVLGGGAIIGAAAGIGQWVVFPLFFILLVLVNGLWSGLSLCWVSAPILRKVVTSLDLVNADDLDRLTQGQGPVSRTGEGMADFLDIDVASI